MPKGEAREACGSAVLLHICRLPMTLTELKVQITLGEDSRRQFKRDVTNADSLAAEMAAFANLEGGMILLGVKKVKKGDRQIILTD